MARAAGADDAWATAVEKRKVSLNNLVWSFRTVEQGTVRFLRTGRDPIDRAQLAGSGSVTVTPVKGTVPRLKTWMLKVTVAPGANVRVSGPSACLRMSIFGVLPAAAIVAL